MKTHAFVVGLLFTATLASGQSLGEIAQTAAAGRAVRTQPIAKKVYTDKDLPAEPPAPTPAAPMTRSVTAPASAATARGEGYWRDRMRPLVDRLTEDTAALEAATALLNDYAAATAESRVDVNGIPLVNRSLQMQTHMARNEASRLVGVVKADQAALDRFMETARKAGALPGWLR